MLILQRYPQDVDEFDLRSLVLGFGESCTIVQGINSESEKFLPYNLSYIDIFVDHQPFGSNLKGRLFDPGLGF